MGCVKTIVAGEKKEEGSSLGGFAGDDLGSHPAAGAVSSVLAGLTTGFEKGPGGTLPLQSPANPRRGRDKVLSAQCQVPSRKTARNSALDTECIGVKSQRARDGQTRACCCSALSPHG